MKGIAIYVEGGGDTGGQKGELRQGMDGLLTPQKDAARRKRIRWRLVPSGGRQAAYEAFVHAVGRDPETINVLLVDSETAVVNERGTSEQKAGDRVTHLEALGGWDLSGVSAERVHLMVQCMEAWIVADPEALATFYGQSFRKRALPARKNLENEPKNDLYRKLEHATEKTQKGAYGKIRHASQLLRRIDPNKVAARCPRFATFAGWLTQTIEEA